MHVDTPARGAQQKAPVHLEDEGTEPNRGTTTIYPNTGPCQVCAVITGAATNHRALTGAPETSYCGVAHPASSPVGSGVSFKRGSDDALSLGIALYTLLCL